ncbi:MarR family winged helix-turn-helix transcriptional regulator [Spirosoma utsteinense]|uniref:DNA-binding MarR family transcriptional regulator n=1 Tax=Spirosoma utsteinense TaxID=2585773 RepID=A0ABR6W9Y9_9BACT|nr:MarR family transcriptional regulator [Spirosoma utsteinense]MBC3787046.1 DNA-binding MarR family transcriptional regulator [Spirosoma utsteinense]MBC3793373.1 DNA-binding MarR family transcriptional regulator [Spirosoma utsteinense]
MDKLLLANQVCFPLYALSRQVTALYRPLLEKLDLTYPQYLVLLLLWETDRVSVSDIGDRLLLDSGTLTPLLKRMEQKGLISRTRNPADERQVTIQLTESGRALQEQALNVPTDLQASLNLGNEPLIALRVQLQTLLDQISVIK